MCHVNIFCSFSWFWLKVDIPPRVDIWCPRCLVECLWMSDNGPYLLSVHVWSRGIYCYPRCCHSIFNFLPSHLSSYPYICWLVMTVVHQWCWTDWTSIYYTVISCTNIQWGTKPFKCLLKLDCFLNNSGTTQPNMFKFCTKIVLLHNLYLFPCY